MPCDQPNGVGFDPGAIADVRTDPSGKFPAMALPAGTRDLVLTKFGDMDLRRRDIPLLAPFFHSTRLAVQFAPATAATARDQIHHLVRMLDHPPRLARVAGLPTARPLPATARLRGFLAQPVRGRGLAGIAAVFLELALKLLVPTLQLLQRIEQMKDQGVLLRRIHAAEFGLRGALWFHAVSLAHPSCHLDGLASIGVSLHCVVPLQHTASEVPRWTAALYSCTACVTIS